MTILATLVLCTCATVNSQLLNAIEKAESNYNVNAVGDSQKSIGSFQIQMSVITDVNQFYKTKFSAKSRYNRQESKQICILYLEYWGKHYQKLTRKAPTNEIYARIWNGGPQGWNPKYKHKYALTTIYWKKKIRPRLEGK